METLESQDNETNQFNNTFPDYKDSKYEFFVVPTTLRLNTLYVNVYLIFMNLVMNGKQDNQNIIANNKGTS